jgi:uncharacterized membrane protein YphA (DoxX/SURF4 family)
MGALQVILKIADPTGTASRILGQITEAVRKNKALLIVIFIVLIPLALILGLLVPVFSIPAIISGIITLIVVRTRKPENLKWLWNNEDKNLWRIFFLGSLPISIGGAIFVYFLWIIIILQEVFIKTP